MSKPPLDDLAPAAMTTRLSAPASPRARSQDGSVRNLLKAILRRTPVVRPVMERLAYYRQFEQFCPLGHYYSPVPAVDAGEARHGHHGQNGHEQASVDSTLPGIDLNVEGQQALIRQLAASYPEMPFTDQPKPGLRYSFGNTFFTYADAILFYGMIRHARPRRIIEVGSGWSSAVALDTNELFFGGEISCTFVEPDPVRLMSLLKEADHRTTRIYSKCVQDVDTAIFAELGPGDILFIDSSHVTKVGSDVNHLLFEVLPALAAGVNVHFHDLFYPFEYPAAWIAQGRGWNEAYLLRAFLQYNSAFRIVSFGAFLQQIMGEELSRTMPLIMKSPAQSLWVQKIA